MSAEPIVTVKQGKLRGKEAKNYNGGTYYSFKGIPFGKPPIGDLRFKLAQPAEPWEGVRDAFETGNECRARDMITLTTIIGSEDCLYLNVYTPQLSKDALKPVMVFIHGGAFAYGSGNPEIYGPNFLLCEDVLLVTINYRLGALGFLAFPNPEVEVPGNNGLKDQVLALKWIQENIAQFGGDPGNVTIFGESAGAASVHYHILSPMSKGLFHRGICQSGSANSDWACDKARPHQLAKVLGCTSTNDMDVYNFLKEVPVDDLVKAQDKVINDEDLREGLSILWGPNVEVACKSEPAFLTEHPMDVMRSGRYNRVPTIFGYNKDEGLLFLSKVSPKGLYLQPCFTDNEVMVPRNLHLQRGSAISKKTGDDLRRFYYKDTVPSMDNVEPFVDLMTDISFGVPIYLAAKTHGLQSDAPTYLYRFCVDSPLSVFKVFFEIPFPGAAHGDELAYLFTNLMTPAKLPEGSQAERTVRRLTKLWTSFAKTGNPNTHNCDELINVEWKPATATEMNYLNIDDVLEVGQNPDAVRMELWERLLAKFESYVVPKL